MTKIIINVPVVVDADVESFTSSDEATFQLDRTDFVRLTNITFNGSMIVSAAGVSIIEE